MYNWLSHWWRGEERRRWEERRGLWLNSKLSQSKVFTFISQQRGNHLPGPGTILWTSGGQTSIPHTFLHCCFCRWLRWNPFQQLAVPGPHVSCIVGKKWAEQEQLEDTWLELDQNLSSEWMICLQRSRTENWQLLFNKKSTTVKINQSVTLIKQWSCWSTISQ